MTYYLKYRPQKIKDLDIDSVRENLKALVKSKNIPHALLFNGPKGTGKTSAARIIAKILNCNNLEDYEPCNKCDNCLSIINGSNLDIIELDAASNRGIDDIRSLKESVYLTPIGSKAKVYIIDEAHMLTNEASNALLKTLEEPPIHTYFILATTNPEKLIDTIKSRTVAVNFTKAGKDETKRALKRIIELEKIDIDDNIIDKIIKLSKGSFRDSVKLLEQFSQDKKAFDSIDILDVDDLISKLMQKKGDICLSLIDKQIKDGMDIGYLTDEIIIKLQEKLVENKDKNIINLIEIILKFQEYVKVSPIEELPLQLAVVKWCND